MSKLVKFLAFVGAVEVAAGAACIGLRLLERRQARRSVGQTIENYKLPFDLEEVQKAAHADTELKAFLKTWHDQVNDIVTAGHANLKRDVLDIDPGAAGQDPIGPMILMRSRMPNLDDNTGRHD